MALAREPTKSSELRRIHLPKLFGNSELIPNRGYEAAKRGQRSPDRLPLGAKEECSRHLLLFSKQFLHAETLPRCLRPIARPTLSANPQAHQVSRKHVDLAAHPFLWHPSVPAAVAGRKGGGQRMDAARRADRRLGAARAAVLVSQPIPGRCLYVEAKRNPGGD